MGFGDGIGGGDGVGLGGAGGGGEGEDGGLWVRVGGLGAVTGGFVACGAFIGACQSSISFSTSFLAREYCFLDISITFSILEFSGFSIGGKVVAENGAELMPSIISFRYI